MPIQFEEFTLYAVEDLSTRLGITERTARHLLHTGKLRGRKLAKKWYVTDEQLRAYFREDGAWEQGE